MSCRVALLAALALGACSRSAADTRPTNPDPASSAPASGAGRASAPDPASVADAPANDPRWHDLVRLAIAAHERWGRVDDRARFAPFDCRLPPPSAARFSASEDAATHGAGKLFTVFALAPEDYGFPGYVFPPDRGPEGQPCPGCDAHRALVAAGVRQVLFKDAYEALREPPPDGTYADRDGPRGLWPAMRDGVAFHPGRSLGDFMLILLDPTTPGTDEGWIYATATPEGTITSAGLVAPCMSCHQQQAQRFFGIPYVPAFGGAADH